MSDENNLEDTENEELEDTESDDDEGTENAEEWTPPTKSEFAKLQRQLKRARTEAKTAKDAAAAKPSDDEVENARTSAREEETKRANTRIAKAEARALLGQAGAKGDLQKLIRLIDFDDVDVSDDDEVFGLDDQIEELKTDYPELFNGTKAKNDSRLRGDGSQKPAGAAKPLSSAQMIAGALRG